MSDFTDTINDVLERELWLEVRCHNCQNTVQIPALKIKENRKKYFMRQEGNWEPRLADDLPCVLAAAFFKCSKCKSKDLSSCMVDVRDYQAMKARER